MCSLDGRSGTNRGGLTQRGALIKKEEMCAVRTNEVATPYYRDQLMVCLGGCGKIRFIHKMPLESSHWHPVVSGWTEMAVYSVATH
jgi:hypothetical protein